MHFFGSERGLLATPTKCGTYAVNTEFDPWDSELPNQTSTQFFTIDLGPGRQLPARVPQRPFDPGFRAAGASNGAGAHSPFSVHDRHAPTATRPSRTIGVHTPPGFTATLKGIPYCPDSALQAIEASSYSGHRRAEQPQVPVRLARSAPPGPEREPARIPSTPPARSTSPGPTRAPRSASRSITPAVSGPYDLGNVVNRVAVDVDPSTAEVTATSDPLPQIIERHPAASALGPDQPRPQGLHAQPDQLRPLRGRRASSPATEGAKAEPSSHFQVANCDTLDYEPKLPRPSSPARPNAAATRP